MFCVRGGSTRSLIFESSNQPDSLSPHKSDPQLANSHSHTAELHPFGSDRSIQSTKSDYNEPKHYSAKSACNGGLRPFRSDSNLLNPKFQNDSHHELYSYSVNPYRVLSIYETNAKSSERHISWYQSTRSLGHGAHQLAKPECLVPGSQLTRSLSVSHLSNSKSTLTGSYKPEQTPLMPDSHVPSFSPQKPDHYPVKPERQKLTFLRKSNDGHIPWPRPTSFSHQESDDCPVELDGFLEGGFKTDGIKSTFHRTSPDGYVSRPHSTSYSPQKPDRQLSWFDSQNSSSHSISTISTTLESDVHPIDHGPWKQDYPPVRPQRRKRYFKRRAPDPPQVELNIDSVNLDYFDPSADFENSVPDSLTARSDLPELGSQETNSGSLVELKDKLKTSSSFTNLANIIKNRNSIARDMIFSASQVIKTAKYFQRNSKISDTHRRLKSQIWSSVVTIVLIEGKNIYVPDSDGLPDSFAKFRLGNEKYKTHVAYKTVNPNWLEQFDLHLYDDQAQELEVSVWNKAKPKDDFIGRCVIDLTELEREKTHRLKQPLDECGGNILLLLTISGTTASETISDLTTYEENPKEAYSLHQRYSFVRTFQNLRDVGHLTVRVYKARGLASADLGGKSDPFCVLELVNARLQTQTEYKTLCPSWQKIFTFNVKDITSVLEVTVYDEDRDHKVEFLGKVAIPLLRIRNNEKRWYALKDKKLYSRAKGNFPQILLELSVVWNPIRACIRTLNPKEEKYMQPEIKFKRQVFVRNVMRLKVIIMGFIDISKFVQSCFEWESTLQSTIAFIIFVLGCYYFQPFMVPAAMILIFLKCYIVHTVAGTWSGSEDDDEPFGDDEEDEDDKDKEEKKSLKERLQAIQEVTQTVQNSIGYIATLGESVKNTFNFTVPFLSYLALTMLVVGTIVLYWIPVRYLILLWGVNKFARKLIRPHTIPNNEVLDLLSRVPDNEDLILFRELKVQQTSDAERRRETRKKKII